MKTHLTETEQKALPRLEAIIKVRAGQMTATEAAARLGISRKTWYEWENRGLEAMLEALSDKEPGRPQKQTDPEKEALFQELVEVKTQNILLQESLDINRILNQAYRNQASSPSSVSTPGCKKKPRRRNKRKKK